MPQISLRISNNIDLNQVNLKETFAAIHIELSKMPNLDIKTCHSGIIKEDYSYIGSDDKHATKVYLEVLWIESAERAMLKKELAKNLMAILENILAPQIIKQGLGCIPRVRIGNLGIINLDYHISDN